MKLEICSSSSSSYRRYQQSHSHKTIHGQSPRGRGHCNLRKGPGLFETKCWEHKRRLWRSTWREDKKQRNRSATLPYTLSCKYLHACFVISSVPSNEFCTLHYTTSCCSVSWTLDMSGRFGLYWSCQEELASVTAVSHRRKVSKPIYVQNSIFIGYEMTH